MVNAADAPTKLRDLLVLPPVNRPEFRTPLSEDAGANGLEHELAILANLTEDVTALCREYELAIQTRLIFGSPLVLLRISADPSKPAIAFAPAWRDVRA
jgi:hypothetical protein